MIEVFSLVFFFLLFLRLQWFCCLEKKNHTGREKKWVIAILTSWMILLGFQWLDCKMSYVSWDLGRQVCVCVYIIIEEGTSCYLHSHTLWRAFKKLVHIIFALPLISFLRTYILTNLLFLLFYSNWRPFYFRFNPFSPFSFKRTTEAYHFILKMILSIQLWVKFSTNYLHITLLY